MKLAQLGTIQPPSSIPTTSGDPSGFIASIIRNGITFLIISAFVIAFIWIIFAGYSFIFAGDDPKKVSSAWSRIYWGLLGLVIVIGSFAIIRMVENFFGAQIISGEFKLPTTGR